MKGTYFVGCLSPAISLHADVFLFLRKRKYLLGVIPKNILNQNKNKANLWLLEVMLEFNFKLPILAFSCFNLRPVT